MTLSRRHALFGLFCLSVAIFALEPVQTFVAFSLNADDYNSHSSYILLIPFISATLIYFRRENIFAEPRSSMVWGGLALLIGGVLYYAGRVYRPDVDEAGYVGVMALSLIAFAYSGFFFSYGGAVFRAALFPLMFLGFAVPIPTALTQAIVLFLQKASADMVSVLFILTRTPVLRNGMVFTLPGLAIQVAEACSGIRSTLGMMIVTVLASHLLLRSRWKKIALAAAVVPVSLFKNAVRIVTLSLLATHYDMGFLTGRLHHEGGIVFMLAGLALMYPMLIILIRSEEKTSLETGARL